MSGKRQLKLGGPDAARGWRIASLFKKEADSIKETLRYAVELSHQIEVLGSELSAAGYSVGGFTTRFETVDGKPDGVPKVDPVVLNVLDKDGTPIYKVGILSCEQVGVGRVSPDGELVDLLPSLDFSHFFSSLDGEGGRMGPLEVIQADLLKKVKPEEHAARVAKVKNGQIDFNP